MAKNEETLIRGRLSVLGKSVILHCRRNWLRCFNGGSRGEGVRRGIEVKPRRGQGAAKWVARGALCFRALIQNPWSAPRLSPRIASPTYRACCTSRDIGTYFPGARGRGRRYRPLTPGGAFPPAGRRGVVRTVTLAGPPEIGNCIFTIGNGAGFHRLVSGLGGESDRARRQRLVIAYDRSRYTGLGRAAPRGGRRRQRDRSTKTP